MTTEPPFDVGAVQEHAIWVFDGVQVTAVGVVGVPTGVVAKDEAEYAESPAAFVANT